MRSDVPFLVHSDFPLLVLNGDSLQQSLAEQASLSLELEIDGCE